MNYVITILLIIIALPVLLFSSHFIYLFFSSFFRIRKIDKKIQNITFEYNTFLIHREIAECHNIAFTKPFSISIQNGKTLITTPELSQLEYLNLLKKLELEIDNLLISTSSSITSTPIVTKQIGCFNKVKAGIANANPYKR